MQTSYWSVTAWTRPLHFLGYCWSRWTPRWRWRHRSQHCTVGKRDGCNRRMRLTQEPGTFPPAAPCAQAARSQQASSCTAEPRGRLGSPALEKTPTLRHEATPALVIILLLGLSLSYQRHLSGPLADLSLHLVELPAELFTGHK